MQNENSDFEQALASRRYEYYLNQKINNSDSANRLMERIKEGYDPNEADVFELVCDEQEKIDEYRKMFDVKQRVKDGQITEADYQFLINKIGIKDDYLQPLMKQMFIAKGILSEDSNIKHSNGR